MAIPTLEGFTPFNNNYRTWYRIAGQRQDQHLLPLLCLHGGPGMTHDYLTPLEELAESGRQVILYDQLGSGNSDHPQDPSLWSIPLFIEQLNALRDALGLNQLHLYGQSWGGFLAQEYMLTRPSGVSSLILSNSAASTARWIAEANRLRGELPEEIQQVLNKHEADGSTDNRDYLFATEVYYRHHLCRLDPWPECLNRTLEKLSQAPEVYNSMWGPSEFYCTGSLKDWNIEDRLSEINTPTLILSGRHDESTPSINQGLHDSLKNSEWVLLEESSHTPHLEEHAKYLQVLSDFLQRVEAA